MPEIPDGMLTKAQVCERLDVSEKTLERYLSAGKLTPAMHVKPDRGGRKMPLFPVADVERFEKTLRSPVKPEPTQATKPTSAAVAKVGSDATATLVRYLNNRIGRDEASSVPLTERVALTVVEASHVTGFGVQAIEKAIANNELHAVPLGPRGTRVVGRVAVVTWANTKLGL